MTITTALPVQPETHVDQEDSNRGRVRTAILCTGGAAALTGVLVGGVSRQTLNENYLLVTVLVNAAVIFALLAYITLSTREAVGKLRREIVAEVLDDLPRAVSARDMASVREEIERQIRLQLAKPLAEIIKAYARIKDERSDRRRQDDTVPIPAAAMAAARRVVAVAPMHPHSQVDEVRQMLDDHLKQVTQLLADAEVIRQGQAMVDGANVRTFPKR